MAVKLVEAVFVFPLVSLEFFMDIFLPVAQ